jgi:hypothetical protein
LPRAGSFAQAELTIDNLKKHIIFVRIGVLMLKANQRTSVFIEAFASMVAFGFYGFFKT